LAIQLIVLELCRAGNLLRLGAGGAKDRGPGPRL